MPVNINGSTGISGVDGSAGTPALQGSDTNTGVFFGTNTIDLSTDGTSRLSIGTDGDLNVDSGTLFVDASTDRVGVGTTGPNRQFVVNGGGSEGVIQITNNTSGTAAANGFELIHFTNGETQLLNRENGPMVFRVNDTTEAFRIDSSGRLLVGTNTGTSAQAIITDGLQVTGAAADGNTDRATLDYSAPLARLMSHNNASGGSIAFFVNVASFGVAERGRFTTQGFFKASSDGTYNSVTAQNHEFCQHVGGDTNTVFECSHNSNPFGVLIRYPNVAPNGSGNEFLRCLDSSATRLVVTSNGGIQNFSANNVNLSDEREKKNIESLDSTWDCLKHWELKKFHYNGDKDTDDKKYGVIAQQVAPHCPEIVSDWIKQKAEDAILDEDGNIVTPASEEVTRLAVKEQQMMWMAIKALQEAMERIETLETRLTALEGGTN